MSHMAEVLLFVSLIEAFCNCMHQAYMLVKPKAGLLELLIGAKKG